MTKNTKKPALKLVGEDGNAFAILARARQALKKSGATADEIAEFTTKATAGSYEDLLAACMERFDVR